MMSPWLCLLRLLPGTWNAVLGKGLGPDTCPEFWFPQGVVQKVLQIMVDVVMFLCSPGAQGG